MTGPSDDARKLLRASQTALSPTRRKDAARVTPAAKLGANGAAFGAQTGSQTNEFDPSQVGLQKVARSLTDLNRGLLKLSLVTVAVAGLGLGYCAWQRSAAPAVQPAAAAIEAPVPAATALDAPAPTE